MKIKKTTSLAVTGALLASGLGATLFAQAQHNDKTHQAGAAAPPQMWISAACDAQEVTLELRDNGSGIAPAQLPHVFDPFFTTKPVGKGTGLGLSISYGIVEQHGGSLTAGNHPDGGACFMLRLPLR